MAEFRVVPDILREREPIVQGRPPRNPLSKKLLAGQTVFITDHKNTWGNLYTLAKHHGQKCRTKKTSINGEIGTLCWFEKPSPPLPEPDPNLLFDG